MMDTKTRAEKIWHDLQNLNLSVSEVDFIAAQIDEAVAIAWDAGCVKGQEVGFSRGKEMGFAQAREQVAGIVKASGPTPNPIDLEADIRAMTPGGK